MGSQVIRPSAVPGAHCLSVVHFHLLSPHFEIGLRCSLRDNGYLTRDGEVAWGAFMSTAMRVFMTPCRDFSGMLCLEKQLQQHLPDRIMSDNVVTGIVAGYLCASVVDKMTQVWQLISTFYEDGERTGTDDETLVLGGMIKVVITNLRLVENATSWLSTLGKEENLMCRLVLNVGLYWYVQHALFLVHSYSLIKSEGWKVAHQIYTDGGMPWQVGWFQISPSAVRHISKILG
jgi:hypothetical protein